MSPRISIWLLGISLTAGCSLVVDTSTTQCVVDSDCTEPGNHPLCQEGVCVDSGLGPPGCFYGTPMAQEDFANQCTTSQVIPFDNCKRLNLCTSDALASAMTVSATPVAGVVSAPINNEPMPLVNCIDVSPNVIFITGSTNLPPLIKAVQPLLNKGNPAYTAIFAPQTSCKGAASVYDLDPNKHKITATTNPTNNWPFYYDANGVQTFCLLDATGVTVDVGESDVYPTSCNPTYIDQVGIADYHGPIQAITFIVPASSTQVSISAEAAHWVFAAGSNNGLATPWVDPNQYFTRSSGTGTIQMASRVIGLNPTMWWGYDRLSAANMVAALEAIDMAHAESSIGLLSNDFADRTRGNLRVLAFQQQGQKYGYLPDSSIDTFDKANVRDGHYPIWGPVHLIAATVNGVPSPAASALVTQFSVPKLDENLVAAIIGSGFVPQCAMKVARTAEIGALTAYKPQFGCGCFFDAKVNGATTCQACTGPGECSASAPACNYGYCEVQ